MLHPARRGRIAAFIVVGAFGLVAGACTLIVSKSFSDTDGYGQQVPPKAPDKCSLTDNDASSNACADCISANCGPDVTFACNASESQPWFQYIKDCAENPATGSSVGWGCAHYDDPDAQVPNNGTDDTAKERQSEICIYRNCLTSPTPPCHQCTIATTKPGSGGGPVSLDDSQCGRCIRSACGAALVSCCHDIPSDLAKCGYPQAEYKAPCLALADPGDAGPPKDTSNQTAVCKYRIATQCFTSTCQALCNQGL